MTLGEAGHRTCTVSRYFKDEYYSLRGGDITVSERIYQSLIMCGFRGRGWPKGQISQRSTLRVLMLSIDVGQEPSGRGAGWVSGRT